LPLPGHGVAGPEAVSGPRKTGAAQPRSGTTGLKIAVFLRSDWFFRVAISIPEPTISPAFGVFAEFFQARRGFGPHPIFKLWEEHKMAKKSGSKPLTKTEIMRNISETTGLQKKDVVAVMESLTSEIQRALKGSGIGVFSIPGLVKIERRKVPARPAQKGVKNPFTGELQDRPAKPASVKVRVRALKNLKAMVSG
jgi:nucleoid DNA-binding protein